ncbi:MAG: hypothetical protein RLZZ127_3104 [Planctomycetota bacterium]|jgi:AraC-like DNA-binding protein
MQRKDWTRLALAAGQESVDALAILRPAVRAIATGRTTVVPVQPWTARRPPPGRQERTQGPRLILHLGGPLTLHHGGGSLAVKPGTLLVFPEACAYGEESVRSVACILIVARGDGLFAHVAVRQPERTPEVQVVAWSAETGGRSFEHGVAFALAADLHGRPQGAAHQTMAVRAVGRLLLGVLADVPVPPLPAAGPPLVRRVLGLVAERCADPAFGVATIAATVGRHPASLTRAIRIATGHSLIALLRRARLDRAERLLNDPRLKVAEVARRSGFGTVRRLRIAWGHDHQTPPSVVRRHAHRAGP